MDNERILIKLGKQYRATLALFDGFVEEVAAIELPSLRFHPWTRREGELAFEFLGSLYLLRHAFKLKAEVLDCRFELVRTSRDGGTIELVRSVYPALNDQPTVKKDESSSMWDFGLPGGSRDLFSYLLIGDPGQRKLPTIPASLLNG